MNKANSGQARGADAAQNTPGPGIRAAAIFALVAHRLDAFFEHEHWLSQAQASALCQDWLLRSKQSLSLAERKHLADLSDELAGQIRDSLSREAGLFTAHELMEALDPRHVSELGESVMDECVRLLERDQAAQPGLTS